MRWIKHHFNFSRSAAMSEVREKFGAAGYGAVWLILERIAEDFAVTPQKSEPDLCISEKEWKNSCGLSTQKLHDLLEILQNHGVISTEKHENRIRVKSAILAQLLDEWTKRTRKKPESGAENPGAKQTREDKDKIIKDKEKNITEGLSRIREALNPVLERHGLFSEPERARRIIRHMEQKNVRCHGAYLEKILQADPGFDPEEETANNKQADRGQEAVSAGEILRREGFGKGTETHQGACSGNIPQRQNQSPAVVGLCKTTACKSCKNGLKIVFAAFCRQRVGLRGFVPSGGPLWRFFGASGYVLLPSHPTPGRW